MIRKAAIVSIAGTSLTRDEITILNKEKPWGIILFKRNILSEKQLGDLIKEKESNSEDFSKELFFQLYKLLGDEEYLSKSYEKVQEALNKVEEDLKAVYLDYPIEKQIIAEYKKIVGGGN